MYTYKISPLKIVDGDTIDADVDLGFDIKVKINTAIPPKVFKLILKLVSSFNSFAIFKIFYN